MCQILNSRQSRHWVTSSYLDPEVKLYDSLATQIPEDIQQQLRAIYPSAATDGVLNIQLPKVQQQNNARDCGVFAVAYLFHLALRDCLEDLRFEQEKMREHLALCFELQTILPFPSTVKCTRKATSNTVILRL